MAYNSTDKEYLVVWHGNEQLIGGHPKYEIFGQRVAAAGYEIGVQDFRLSDMGPDEDPDYYALSPAVNEAVLQVVNAIGGYTFIFQRTIPISSQNRTSLVRLPGLIKDRGLRPGFLFVWRNM